MKKSKSGKKPDKFLRNRKITYSMYDAAVIGAVYQLECMAKAAQLGSQTEAERHLEGFHEAASSVSLFCHMQLTVTLYDNMKAFTLTENPDEKHERVICHYEDVLGL
ncbi:MAG: hypothetical protein LBB94_03910 [Clostridiales bacterium]|jgi:hypothetical protein|nr:hypothetical protein [Clostridiales bacterium]